jgi:hypothetical protein
MIFNQINIKGFGFILLLISPLDSQTHSFFVPSLQSTCHINHISFLYVLVVVTKYFLHDLSVAIYLNIKREINLGRNLGFNPQSYWSKLPSLHLTNSAILTSYDWSIQYLHISLIRYVSMMCILSGNSIYVLCLKNKMSNLFTEYLRLS